MNQTNNPTKTTTSDNWIKAQTPTRSKAVATSALSKAKQMESEKLESGKFHYIPFIDAAGKKSLKLTKKHE